MGKMALGGVVNVGDIFDLNDLAWLCGFSAGVCTEQFL